ncbi:MAG: hypothetical protein V9G15_13120 [Dermatophilaceae bacterium]
MTAMPESPWGSMTSSAARTRKSLMYAVATPTTVTVRSLLSLVGDQIVSLIVPALGNPSAMPAGVTTASSSRIGQRPEMRSVIPALDLWEAASMPRIPTSRTARPTSACA